MEADEPSESLEEIENAFRSLAIHSDDVSRASEAIGVLANASRWHPETREQLADPKVLRLLVEVVECSINDAVETTELALRCIGNACIDNNIASQEVTNLGFSWAKQCLPGPDSDAQMVEPTVAMLAVKVLYNICSDFEPAQQRCFQEHIHYNLISVGRLEEVIQSDAMLIFIELLFWICSHLQPDQSELPALVLAKLLDLPQLYQNVLAADDFALLLETCLLYLREPEVKKDVVIHSMVGKVWQMLEGNEKLVASLPLDDDDRKLLPPLTTALIWILSDLAASAEFVRIHNLEHEWIRNVIAPAINTIDPSGRCTSSPRLVDAASQVLGNLLWSLKDRVGAISNIQDVEALGTPLLLLLSVNEDSELLHSAAGLLVQLVRLFPTVRELIGADDQTPRVVELLCKNPLPQLKQDGIALLRALGKDSPVNQERFAGLARTALSQHSTSDTAMIET